MICAGPFQPQPFCVSVYLQCVACCICDNSKIQGLSLEEQNLPNSCGHHFSTVACWIGGVHLRAEITDSNNFHLSVSDYTKM